MRPAPLRALALLLLLAPLGVAAGPDPAAGQAPVDLPPPPARPAAVREGEVAVVPDRFLRRWDPVTLFFPSPLGPARGGPEERPERFVTLSPGHPGGFSWLDARTLQFQPAEPWPALARLTVSAAGRSFPLAVLLPAPLSSHPSDGAEGLERLDEITLTFPDPVDPAALAAALEVEIAPLPGVGSEGARRLAPGEVAVKPLPPGSAGAPAYALRLPAPVPGGHRVRLRLRLSPEAGDGALAAELAFATATPFRALAFGCRERQLPVLPAGARYPAERALACEADDPAVVVDFSALPRELGIAEARNLVRLSPPVPDLAASLSGRRLELRGAFARETAYRVRLVPAPLGDETGRPLDLAGANELVLSFPRPSPYLRLAAATGIAERRGPQMVPLAGRGEERIDLRIHRIDPLDRAFWPFPAAPVAVDEGRRPPGPGERPAAWGRPESGPSPDEIAARIAALGSPSVSAIVDLPLRRDGGSASFGLDLQPHLARLAGEGAPGTYLVGLRRLDGGPERRWLRLQVSDLALTTLEEPRRTVFLVTSLASAQPVAGAEVRVEGVRWAGGRPSWVELFRGRTDASGRAAWRAPGSPGMAHQQVARLSVAAGDDLLVLDPQRPPETFHDGRWSADGGTWLQWTQEALEWRGGEPERLAHLFTERPVYRPEEPVHLKAYLRTRSAGRLAPLTDDGVFVIDGPGDLVWRYPVTPEENGSAYLLFDEPGLPTGTYRARFETLDGEGAVRGAVSFRKEAYRLPRFEVRLDGPVKTPLDRPFELALAATYYAGGRVAARPVEWRVTQFPHDWAPAGRPGFLFSSDARFAGGGRFESTPAFARADTTDEDGGARLRLDPGVEPTAQPRVYVVEATVVDVDEQTVTATRQVVALPPLLLGLRVPRYLEEAGALAPEVLVLGPDEKPLAGQPVTVRLRQRRWHSHLRASDFTDGVARYVTEMVEEDLEERLVTSGTAPVAADFTLPEAGVYVVELEARDRLGRSQRVAVDLFAGGGEPVAWPRPATPVFHVTPDRAKYAPGETARLVLQSPFQNGEALAIVEAPGGTRYEWLPVRGGQAVLSLPVEGSWTPKVPVHFLLLRGRLEGTRPLPGNATDPGRPATFGATVWLEVEPRAHRLALELEHPTRARPGEQIEIALRLRDPDGNPLAGEVTLWLVDQAVLALGREQRLDPVPSFLGRPQSLWSARDTRSLVFGFLPFTGQPGGDEGEEAGSLLDRQTVRRNFQPVPFYEPRILVGPDGEARVRLTLPDDLTNFLVRAKAAAGDERFGHATGRIEVRLPVLLQPALPRFLRPGDRFLASAVGRVLDGTAGAGTAEARVEGARLEGAARADLAWAVDRPVRADFPVAVPPDASGEARFRIAAERRADGAGDAFELRLPVRADRERVLRRELVSLAPGATWRLPEPAEAVRAGSLSRRLLLTGEPRVAALANGLDFLLAYPHGCTEQRLAAARAQLALARFRDLLGADEGGERLARAVADTLAWLPLVQQPSGLFSFWPGGAGSVTLTAWTAEFLAEAAEAGHEIDPAVRDAALRALAQALRSDYAGLLDGEEWGERTAALRALARSGRFDPAYGNELARRAQFLDLEGRAGVLAAFQRAGQGEAPATGPLADALWEGIGVRLHQGREIFGGLAGEERPVDGRLLPSDARTMAEMLRALRPLPRSPERERRFALLAGALVALGRGDGWGSTNANAAAILALSELLSEGRDAPMARAELRLGGRAERLEVGGAKPALQWRSEAPGAAELAVAEDAPAPLSAAAELSYLPAAPGSEATPRQEGFVLRRTQLVHRGGVGAAPPEQVAVDRPGARVELVQGEIVEERIQIVNPEDRHYVAVVVPLAAGFEPLNPALETAPPEARPSGRATLDPTYAAFLDDQAAFYFDALPKGTYELYFRLRAQIPGTFVQPPAKVEMMYDASVVGTSAGATVEIAPRPER